MKILIIMNPISGGKDKLHYPQYFEKVQQTTQSSIEVIFSQHRGHAHEIALKHLNSGFDTIVAAGGDGTINEVASALIHSNIPLMVFPLGSGNGFARFFGIRKSLKSFIHNIRNHSLVELDVFELNGKPFFNAAGVGFDAHIAQLFATKKKRGFTGYFIAVIKAFQQFPEQRYRLFFNGASHDVPAFFITFANSNQFGNDAIIAPQANMMDEKLEICIVKKFNIFILPILGMMMKFKLINYYKGLTTFQSDDIILERTEPGPVHIDGEPVWLEHRIHIGRRPEKLKFLKPN